MDNGIAQVSLSEAIGEVRAELARAIEAGKDSAVAFRAGPVELEFQVGFDKTASADAGLRVWVLSAGAKGAATQSTTHRLTVTLMPVTRDGEDALISSVDRH